MKEALKGEDIEAIKSKKEELTQSFYKVSEELYKQAAAQAQAQQQGTDGAQGANPQGGANKGDDGYYEADYTDVEDGNK